VARRGRDGRQQRDAAKKTEAAHASSSPRIVPVDDANLSLSMPMRWSMET
jgi:hypothetical protein